MYLSAVRVSFPKKKQLKRERLDSDSQFKGRVHRGREAKVAGTWSIWAYHIALRKQRVRNEFLCSHSFLCTIHPGTNPSEWCCQLSVCVLPNFSVRLPTSIILIKFIPHRLAQRSNVLSLFFLMVCLPSDPKFPPRQHHEPSHLSMIITSSPTWSQPKWTPIGKWENKYGSHI